MSIVILKAICHQHNLKDKKLLSATSEISLNDASKISKIQYLSDLLENNSKRNIGKLATFQKIDGANLFETCTVSIFNDNKLFVSQTKLIMKELIQEFTLGSSTSGNYLFVLYHIKENENYLNDDGNLETVSVDEDRLSLLKFEFQNSQHIDFKETGKEIIPDIIIEKDQGLPGEEERVKKAVFINNIDKNKLNYQLRVVDKESPGIAHFFTEKILSCKYIVKPKNYLSSLKKIASEHINSIMSEGMINENESKIAINNFYNIIHAGYKIDQTKLGNILFSGVIDDEDLLKQQNKILIEKCHSKGLTFNYFQISKSDEELFHKNQYIYFGDHKKSHVMFSEADEKEGTITIPSDKNEDYNKYVIQILVDEYPKSLITKHIR